MRSGSHPLPDLLVLLFAALSACAERPTVEVARWEAELSEQLEAQPRRPTMALPVAGNWAGELHPCECAAGMDGGIARAAVLWRDADCLPIVIGSLLSVDEALRPSETACIRAVLNDVGALGFGVARPDLDASGAPPDLGTATPVSLNVPGARPFRAWREVGASVASWTHVSAPLAGSALAPEDTERLREAVAFLRARSAYLLVTTDCQSGDLVRVMEAAVGCDLLITGGRAGATSGPVVRSGVSLMVLGPRGEAVIEVPRDGGSPRRVLLDPSVPKDGFAWARVEEAFRAHAQLGMARIDADATAATDAAACAACHAEAAAKWRTTGHARAWSALPEGRRGDPRCASCHATPVGRPGGGLQLRPDVACSACHEVPDGHGTERGSAAVGFVSACVRCHDERNSPGFGLTAALQRISCRERVGDSHRREER